jgi:phosphoketolase
MSGHDRYLFAAHYLAGAQIYLLSNALLREPLRDFAREIRATGNDLEAIREWKWTR